MDQGLIDTALFDGVTRRRNSLNFQRATAASSTSKTTSQGLCVRDRIAADVWPTEYVGGILRFFRFCSCGGEPLLGVCVTVAEVQKS